VKSQFQSLRDSIFIVDANDDMNFANCVDLGNLASKMVRTGRHKISYCVQIDFAGCNNDNGKSILSNGR
jgi:hypothetical protein